MLGKLFDKILEEREEAGEEIKKPIEKEEKGKKISRWSVLLALFILVLAFAPRLYYLFFVSGTQNAGAGWYGDTYHHWQIAYLTKTVGFKHGFLRLWDLKGMEYFWGILHPLVLVVLFTLTGSVDILVPRLLSVFCGSLSVVLLFLIVRRYFNFQSALASAILIALNPIGVFNDASGMQEPLGIVLLLAGIYLWPQKDFLTGILWALSGMVRAEFWLFGLGLVGAILILERNFNRKIGLSLGYGIPTLFYMKVLLDKTGNPIYPVWWSFLGNAVGRWQAKVPLTQTQYLARFVFIAIFALSSVGILFVFRKKPRGWLLSLLGLGNFWFLGGFVGLTEYIKSYVHYFWVVRIFLLPYIFLGFALAVLFLEIVPKAWPVFGRLKLGWIFVFLILAASQLSWRAIWYYFGPTIPIWENEVELAEQVAGYYKEGTILLPEYDPQFTYALVKLGGIKGENIEGQMFDVFYYLDGDAFSDWLKNRARVLDWLKEDNIRLLVVDEKRHRYQELIAREPQFFKLLDKNSNFCLEIYEVRV